MVKLAPPGWVTTSGLGATRDPGGFLVQLLTRRRERHDARVEDVDDLRRVHVDDHHDALDGTAIEVRLVAFEVGEGAQHAAALQRGRDLPGGPRVDLHLLEIRDLTLPHGRLPARIGLDDLRDGFVLAGEHERLHALDLVPGDHARRSEVRDGFEGAIAPGVDDHRERLSRDRRSGLVRQHVALRWFFYDQRDVLRVRGPLRRRAEHFRRGADFVRCQRIERMLSKRAARRKEGEHDADDCAGAGHRSSWDITSTVPRPRLGPGAR